MGTPLVVASMRGLVVSGPAVVGCLCCDPVVHAGFKVGVPFLYSFEYGCSVEVTKCGLDAQRQVCGVGVCFEVELGKLVEVFSAPWPSKGVLVWGRSLG